MKFLLFVDQYLTFSRVMGGSPTCSPLALTFVLVLITIFQFKNWFFVWFQSSIMNDPSGKLDFSFQIQYVVVQIIQGREG